ncbi:hypothetical protein ACHHYP_00243 [Achlya hypogyna]|uniref:Rho-GAP domain-containing protein n=1 Tax=Achlya hypogyna TaxID=1202772 RepID=A0A1V9ZB73_ACHHY|nr:hypothetical protein ACHHYP_00243 [Achlya hypogyna]
MMPRIGDTKGRLDSLRKIDAFVDTLTSTVQATARGPRVDMHSELGVDILVNVFSGYEASAPFVRAPLPSQREYEAMQLAQLRHAFAMQSKKGSWNTQMQKLDAAIHDKQQGMNITGRKRDDLHAAYGLAPRSRKTSTTINGGRRPTRKLVAGKTGSSLCMDMEILAASEVHTRLQELFDINTHSEPLLDRSQGHIMTTCMAKHIAATSRPSKVSIWTPEAIEDMLFGGDDHVDAVQFRDRFLRVCEMVTQSTQNKDQIAFIDDVYIDVAAHVEEEDALVAAAMHNHKATRTAAEKPTTEKVSLNTNALYKRPMKKSTVDNTETSRPRRRRNPDAPTGPRRTSNIVQEILSPAKGTTATATSDNKENDERTASQVLQDRLTALQENRKSILEAEKRPARRLMSKMRGSTTLGDDETDLQECKGYSELAELRESVHMLLNQVDEGDNNASAHGVASAGRVCGAIEACLHHGLKRVSATETVSLWGLIQWTNIAQQKRHQVWKQAHAKAQVDEPSQEWYNDMFKEELQRIASLGEDNQRSDSYACDSTHDRRHPENPLTPGLSASIRTANSLLHVVTPRGKVRAWIRQCCNTHILSACLAGLMHPLNHATLQTYFVPGALCLNEDAREIFVGLTSTLDRLQFGFVLDTAELDSHASPSLRAAVVAVPLSSQPEAPVAEPRDVLGVLDSQAQRLHEMLRITPASILSPRALDEAAMGAPPSDGRRLFGTPLAVLVMDPRSCDLGQLDPAVGVPNLVEGCCRLIDAAASAGTPGLFAAKINKTRFVQLVQQVEAAGILSIWSSVHHGIILLIKFLRDLPEPLFPCHLYRHFLSIQAIDGTPAQVLAFRQAVQQLHWSVKPTLVRLFATLTRVAKLSADTTITHLAQVFANVLFPRDASAANQAIGVDLVALLLTHADAILIDTSEMLSARRQHVHAKTMRITSIPSERRTDVALVANGTWTSFLETYGLDDTPALHAALRGGGRLVITCMQHFVVEHQEIALQIIAQRRAVDKKQYPLPSASVYLVRMLVELLGLDAPVDFFVDMNPAEWTARCDAVGALPVPAPVGTRAALAIVQLGLWPLFDEPHAFERLFGMSLLLFDRNWTRSGASCMDFNTILTETQCQMQSLLRDEPASVAELWQRWSDRISQQYLQPPSQTPRALAHMRSYVVVADNVTVRTTPTRDADACGVRTKGERIETVLKAGEWLKIRDVPGSPDAGWVLRRTAVAALLELVD